MLPEAVPGSNSPDSFVQLKFVTPSEGPIRLAGTVTQSYTTAQDILSETKTCLLSPLTTQFLGAPRPYHPLHVVAVAGGLLSGENHVQPAHACV